MWTLSQTALVSARRVFGLTALVLGALVGAPALAQTPPPPANVAVEDPPVFPLAQVKRGLKGSGYTVFESHLGAEPFDFVVLGVMRDYLGPGEDLIIAELQGEKIERTGVISGMSGSPVYVDGKIVGAVGYRFGSFTKRPIAGITPIERMLAVREPPKGVSRSPAAAPRGGAQTAWGVGEPITVPIAVSGLAPRVAAAFRPHLEERGYGPLLPGASSVAVRAGGKPQKGERLWAAGPIAGLLVDGDLRMAAIGTVTWVKGDRFLAFGHPFLGQGFTQMPVASAEIVTTVASEAGSWKMGQATGRVGRLTDDRLHAIAGDMGATPSTVAMKVDLQLAGPRAEKDAKEALRFSVMRHPTDTPLFAAMALANALGSRVGVEPGGTLTTRGIVTLSSGERVEFERRVATDALGIEISAALAVLAELGALVGQSFAEVEIEEVALNVKREPAVKLQQVLSVDVDGRLSPGRSATVRLRVLPYKDQERTEEMVVRVPAGIDVKRWHLWAVAPRDARRLELEGGVAPVPVDFASFLRARRMRPEDGTISLYLVEENAGLRVDGQGLPGLPPSLTGLLQDGGGVSAQLLEKRVVRLGRMRTDGVTMGVARARVRVSAKGESE